MGFAVAFPRGGSSSTVSRSNWNLEVLVFDERGKPEYPEKNLSEQSREPTTNSTHMLTPGPGIEPGTHWWEANALTTAPTLLPFFRKEKPGNFMFQSIKNTSRKKKT